MSRIRKMPRVVTGIAEVEVSMGKGFLKNLSSSGVFEVYQKIENIRLKINWVLLWVILKVWLMKLILI